MDAYEALRKKLDLFPIGLPRSGETLRILELLFSEREAHVASHVPNPPLIFGAARIAAKAGVPREEAAGILSELGARHLIVEQTILGEPRYMLLPAVPGFMEMQFMTGQNIDERRREAGLLWHEALKGPFGKENHGYKTSGVRVIPINSTVTAGQKTHSFEAAEELLRSSGSIAITECACRKSAQKCDAPVDVCFALSTSADYLSGKNLARKVTLREAVHVLENAADAGLVHTTSNSKPPIQVLCNCCACCCASLRGVTSLGKRAQTVRSNFVSAVVSEPECLRCGSCVKLCPMHAAAMKAGGIYIDAGKCLGCGVCVHHCPTSSLTLERRGNDKPIHTSLQLISKMVDERGKTPRILRGVVKDLL